MPTAERLRRLAAAVRRASPWRREGEVHRVVGLLLESRGLVAEVGSLCRIARPQGQVLAEVVGFRGGNALLMPLGDVAGIATGTPVEALDRTLTVPAGRQLLGRVLDALGRPLDGLGPLPETRRVPVHHDPPPPLARPPIREPLPVGVRAIDGLLTCGRGQRVGIFAGSGVGKSTLLGMIARGARADAAVVALVGERGREVREFVERDLGPEGLSRAVVVVATSDQPPLLRIKAALTATAIAEGLRDEGLHVVLLMDSVTRFAMALREVGLAVGEPPATRGYTPSVFAQLPRLLERAGPAERGSITGFYTVLVEGDDLEEPVSDAIRAILDGHVVLSRRLADFGHYPAVDVLASVSRVMPLVQGEPYLTAAARVRAWLGAYRDGEDLVQIGAYRRGTHPLLDEALDRWPAIEAFLRQRPREEAPFADTLQRLAELAGMEVPA